MWTTLVSRVIKHSSPNVVAMGEGRMVAFEFDPQISPDENIDCFFEYLKDRNPKFAKLLKQNIQEVFPLSSGSSLKTTDRAKV